MDELLDTLIPRYAKNKLQLEDMKSYVDEDNKKIKELMTQQDLKSYDTNGYRATVSVQKRESMNEEKLLNIAHEYGIDIIKTKEYIDFDALENAIYHNEISLDVLEKIESCREVKEVYALRVGKMKRRVEE